jgi:hypothetical protein
MGSLLHLQPELDQAVVMELLRAGRHCESELHRATIKNKVHSRQIRIRENAGYAVGIEDFQTQINARRHDFRGARCLKIDGITRLFPRFDGASGSFASDVISIRDKAAGELFGKLSTLNAAMHREFEVEPGAARPGASVVDVTGKALLAAIEIDGGDPLARLHQGNGDVQGYGGFARPALFVTQHNDMS